MKLTLDFCTVWEQLVRSGQTRNRFRASDGRIVESGIRMGAAGPEHYAVYPTSGEEIRAEVQERQLSPSEFILQLNEFRALKPRTAIRGLGRQPDTPADVGQCFFACQDPTHELSLLRRTISLETRFANFAWVATHNAVPIEKNGHFLWTPVSRYGAMTVYPHFVQLLTREFLEDFLCLARASTDLITTYNAMHAGGSVNHIHFQSVYRERVTPLEKAATTSHDGRMFLADYPACGLIYGADAELDQIWADVAKLQKQQIPLNLIHSGERTFLIARNIDHEVVPEFPNGILAGMELSGKAITTEKSFYRQADWATIAEALRKSTLTPERVLALLL